MGNKAQTQLRIRSALSDRDARIACLISETVRNMLDLLEEQSPGVLEAMLEYAREQEPARPKHRAAVRKAMLEYMELYCLKEAKARERRLFQGITGLDEPANPEGHQDQGEEGEGR